MKQLNNRIVPGEENRISQLRYLSRKDLPKGFYFGSPKEGALRGVMPGGFKLQKEVYNGPTAQERYTFKDVKSSKYLLDIINTELAEELFKSENDMYLTTKNVSETIYIILPKEYNKTQAFRVVRILKEEGQ